MKLGTILFSSFLTLSLSVFAGCAAQTEDANSSATNDDEVEVEATEEGITSGPSNFGYYVVTRRDTRRCISPICGGFFVKRVNQDKTLCASGTMEPECYVGSISLTGVNLSAREEEDVRKSVESGKALIKARTYKKNHPDGLSIGTLRASEAWVGATGSAIDGTFYRVADNGIRCITAPCPSTTAYSLNSSDKQNVTDTLFTGMNVQPDQETLDHLSYDMSSKDGILIAGGLQIPRCLPTAHCGPKVVASEIFLRVERREDKGCGSRGQDPYCNSGQFCSFTQQAACGAADVGGKCSYKPQICMAVYKPVCGCDGKTYSNSCHASAAGASVASLGACSL